jgi:hypothetical protein
MGMDSRIVRWKNMEWNTYRYGTITILGTLYRYIWIYRY